MSTYIIAEAGVNHNGSLKLAKQLIEVAADAGVDAVKFQTFRAASLVTQAAAKAAYQEADVAGESQYQMLKRLELSYDAFGELKAHADQYRVQMLSTPFDLASLDFLVDELRLPQIKLSSGDLTNGPLLYAVGRSGLPVILSTGMASLAEIEDAIKVLLCGYRGGDDAPAALADRIRHGTIDDAARRQIALLHCTTEYPAPLEQINLKAMATLAQAFQVKVGYSDHSSGITIPIAAVAMGAEIIEKHFTLDRALPGPDHASSLEPDELKAMVRGIRDVETALGHGLKVAGPAEARNKTAARKSLVAARSIKRGECFTPDNVTVKRPGNGVSPIQYWAWLGRVADRDYDVDDLLQ